MLSKTNLALLFWGNQCTLWLEDGPKVRKVQSLISALSESHWAAVVQVHHLSFKWEEGERYKGSLTKCVSQAIYQSLRYKPTTRQFQESANLPGSTWDPSVWDNCDATTIKMPLARPRWYFHSLKMAVKFGFPPFPRNALQSTRSGFHP